MAMSGAQRQQRYRERHYGNLARTTLDLRLEARDRLDRLAAHYDLSLVELMEQLTASAERAIEARLTGEALRVYRAGYEDDR